MRAFGIFEPPRRDCNHMGVLTASVVGLCLATYCLLGHVRTESQMVMMLSPRVPEEPLHRRESSGEVSSTEEKCFIAI